MTPIARLRILGPLSLRGANGREVAFAQPKRLALLAYLALGPADTFQRRDTLVGLFWPELDREHARHALRQSMHTIHRLVGPEVIRCRGTEEVGIDPDRLLCDVSAFERRVRKGDLVRALELYRGDLLQGFHLRGMSGFEYWLELARDRLRELAASAAWSVAEAEERQGNLTGAARYVRRAAELSPDDEHALRRLMVFHARIGDRAGALRAYERFGRGLWSEYAMVPSSRTEALMLRIREQREDEEEVPVGAVAVRTAASRARLEDVRVRIDHILDPRG